MAANSVWNPDNVVDVAESIGIASLHRDVIEHLARDVEYRISQVVEEALKFMRHGKRTTLTTQDVSQALRLLDVEPLYGYESTRPLRFGEASIGPGQPLFYVEDEEVDFEKLINAPLPKVPREVTYTAHWLAVEGVQPSIPQNPTQADQRNQDLNAKGLSSNQALMAVSGSDNVAIRPLIKHVLSKELQLYFERICTAVFDDANDEYRNAALASLRADPGLHQLIPYLVQFVADKVTHNLKNLFALEQSLLLVEGLLDNQSLFLAPYIPSVVPVVLTCLLAKQVGNPSIDGPIKHFELRRLASSLLIHIARRYGSSSSTLRPRIARSCLKHFLDTHKSYGAHYGAIMCLGSIAGTGGVKSLIIPNLKAYDAHLRQGLRDEGKKPQASYVAQAIVDSLLPLEDGSLDPSSNGHLDDNVLKSSLVDKLGEVVGNKIYELGRTSLSYTLLERDLEL